MSLPPLSTCADIRGGSSRGGRRRSNGRSGSRYYAHAVEFKQSQEPRRLTTRNLSIRNPANTFSEQLQNPAYAANVNIEPFHQFYTYTIYTSGSNTKARNNFTGAVDYVNTTAITTFNSASPEPQKY